MTNTKPLYLWKKAPFTRLLPVLVMGILIQYYFQFSTATSVTCIAIATCLLWIISRLRISFRYSIITINGLLWSIIIFACGMLATSLTDIRNDKAWHGNLLGKAKIWRIKISTTPEEKEKSFKVIGEVVAGYDTDSSGFPAKGKVLLYFSKDSNTIHIRQGDILYIKNKFQQIKNSGNPGSFDYKKYMEYRQVFYQAFLYNSDWKSSGLSEVSLVDKVVQSSLKYENGLFHKYLKGEQVTALASALMTGDRSELDKDLVQAYSNAGVVHIMSISGLHLGLIYIFLIQLVRVIPGISENKIARAVIVLCGIWFFAVLTGCSPSVMRSAVMFTCLHLGQLTNRKVLSYNFWSASAFLLLVYDPMLLWNVGFQLSYAAVLGILIVQKPIYHWIVFDNKLMDYLWQLISVSLAAQLFTLPICLYYFHQVPLLFIIANLVAIPLSSIGLWLCVLLVLTGWIPYIPVAIGTIISLAFQWLNSFINYLDSFTFGVWDNIQLSLFDTFTLLALICLSIYWLLYKSSSALKAITITVWMLTASFGYSYWMQMNQRRLIVYDIRNSTAIDVISGRQYFEVMDNEITSGHSAIQTARQYFGSTIRDTVPPAVFTFENNLVFPFDYSIALIKSPIHPRDFASKRIHLKALIIADSPRLLVADLNKIFEPDIYVFAPSNKRSSVAKWKKECEELHLRSHDISTQGAYVMNY